MFTVGCYDAGMKFTKSQIGVAAVVLLAPGGFVLGATLIAAHYRRRKADAANSDDADPHKSSLVS